ncbi:MAG: hypothetical protein ABL930_04735 [Pseudobdellovibrio sp.]
MKKLMLIGLLVSLVLIVILALLIVFYKSETPRFDLISGMGKAGDQWEIKAFQGQRETISILKSGEKLDLRNAKNSHIKNIAYYADNRVIYDIDYVFDEYGRRTVEIPKTSASVLVNKEFFALFFGCSDLWGAGVNSVDTIPAIFQSKIPVSHAYNYGFPGTGAHYVNFFLQNEIDRSEVTEPKGLIFYVMTEGHFAKTLGHIGHVIRPVMPKYTLQNSELTYLGKMQDVDPVSSQIKKYFGTSSLVTYLGGDAISENEVYTKEDYDLVCSILDAAKINSKNKFKKSRFILVLHVLLPTQDRELLKKCGAEKNIEIVDVHVPYEDRFSSDPVYFHPTRTVNEVVTNHILDYLQRTKKN